MEELKDDEQTDEDMDDVVNRQEAFKIMTEDVVESDQNEVIARAESKEQSWRSYKSVDMKQIRYDSQDTIDVDEQLSTYDPSALPVK